MTNRSICTALLLLLATTVASAQTPTASYSCQALGGTNCPARIKDGPQGATISTLQVPAAAETLCTNGASLSIRLNVIQDWVGDLTASVANPSSSANLLSNLAGAGVGGCQGQDIDASFSDAGSAPTCGGQIPAIGGVVSPVSPLASLGTGTGAPSGTWTLTVADTANDGDGALFDWAVEVTCNPSQPYEYVPVPAMSRIALLLIALLLGLIGVVVVRRSALVE